MVTSKVEIINEVPTLKINDEVIASNAYITYFIENARYDDFTKAGYRLFSVPIYFATRGIQEMNEIPPFAPGIFENEEPDYSIIDKTFGQILKECPDAYIFPRVNMSLPLRWEIENPDELCDYGNANPDIKRPCYASDKWAEDTKKYLGMFIDHIENSPYRDSVVGYQLAAGNAEEWFPYDFNGSKGKRSREKFNEYIKENNLEGTDDEYNAFISGVTADRICEFAEFAKQKTNNRLVIGSFYGYTFEVCSSYGYAHFALNSVLNNKNVDFLCSPVSYMRNRELGIDHPCMLPVDSLKKHGKLYFVENDTRTHLTKPLFDIPHFHNPNYQPRERWVAIENIKQHYARALTHSHALWWFDMGGGWYHYWPYMQLFEDFIKITKESLTKDMRSVSEVAVIVDEKACTVMRNSKRGLSSETLYFGRVNLGLMGTPYDAYLAEDYEDIKDKYKAFIILTPQITTALDKIIKDNKDCLVITHENHDITTDELRDFCKSKGVHIYSDKDAVIYANKSYFFLHTAEHGKAQISMPKGKKLKQIYGDEININEDILPRHTGYLFEVI